MAQPDNIIKDIRWDDKTVIVEATGDIDLHRSNNFQQALQGVLKKKPTKIIISLENVEYMDSSGIATLVKLLSNTRKHKIELAIAGPNKKVQSVFEITRLTSVFKIYKTLDEALK